MNTNRKHMKIPGFARAQIRKAKKNVLYREAAKVYKRNVSAQREATTLQLQCLYCPNHSSNTGWTDRGHTKAHPKASTCNPCDRNDSCVSPQKDSKWNKPRTGSYTIKPALRFISGSTSAALYLPKNFIYSKYKRWMQNSITLPQVQPCNHNPVNPTEYKNNKETKTKQTAQTQKVWQGLSVL